METLEVSRWQTIPQVTYTSYNHFDSFDLIIKELVCIFRRKFLIINELRLWWMRRDTNLFCHS